MNKLLIASAGFLLSVSSITASDLLNGRSFLQPRSQGQNSARQLSGWNRMFMQPCESFYTSFQATAEYSHSYRTKRLAEYFFNQDNLIVSGSQNPARSPGEILADYFGLSTTFQSFTTLKPQIRNGILDFDWFLGYKDWYMFVFLPVAWSRTNFELCEVNAQPGGETYPANYMAPGVVNVPAQSFTQAVRGGLTWGGNTEGLLFGKIGCPESRSGLADVHLAFGYNIVNNECGYAGFNLILVAPTGNRSTAEFLLEPMIGNGHHWEFGAGFLGQVLIWEKDDNKHIDFLAQLRFTHLFASNQVRSFDLCLNGFGSRYILAKDFSDNGYTGDFFPLINKTTLECQVHNTVQFDILLLFAFTFSNIGFDIGYEGWLRSHEKISLCQQFPANTYALKGIQNAVGIATQSTATLDGNLLLDQAIYADPFSPVFINPNELDLNSAANPLAYTNKIFANLNYAWPCGCKNVDPFIGIGGEVEFESLRPRCAMRPNQNSVSQYGIWVKTGFGF